MAHLAVDLGANGGKAYLGRFRGGVSVEEIHRFDNHPVERDGRLVWDIERLSGEIETSIERADSRSALETVGIDTWGLDFGLVVDGELLRVPSAYRDPSVTSTRDGILERFDRREIFEATGINNWNTPNTLWQYHHLVAREPDVVEQTDGIVMMPQLLSTLLGGRTCGELTIASTTQMLDPRTGTWAEGMLETLDLPTDPLPESYHRVAASGSCHRRSAMASTATPTSCCQRATTRPRPSPACRWTTMDASFSVPEPGLSRASNSLNP